MNTNNQKDYWNRVAETKTFTHPPDLGLLEKYVTKEAALIDFGCGYGRVVRLLSDAGYKNVIGYDTSAALINRGVLAGNTALHTISAPSDLPVEDNSTDCILLFAVLTCIPGNAAQMDLINMLHAKLKTGGIIYISDYYLQENSAEVREYQYLNNDVTNYGVFSLPEGAVFRHHTREWIAALTKDFSIAAETSIHVQTMNGHRATGFQLIGRK